MFTDHTHEGFNQINRDFVNTVIIVTIARIFAFCFEVNGDASFVTDDFYFRIFDCAQ
ncbi:hypothetical protein D3C76_1685490 [compost metagenome]